MFHRHGSRTSNCMDMMFIAIASLIALLPASTNSQCIGVWVSNAVTETSINGYYYLVGNFDCGGYDIWMQQNTPQPPNYIFWVYSGANNNGTYVYANSWVIGPKMCSLQQYVYAKNTLANGVYSPYPYSLSNPWQEFNPATMSYETNAAITVTCSNSLSVAAIIGIVIGSLIGFVFIMSIIVCTCAKCNKNKRQTSAVNSPSRSVVYTTGAAVVQCPAYYPPDAADLQPSMGHPTVIVPPPMYDIGPPPSYDSSESPI